MEIPSLKEVERFQVTVSVHLVLQRDNKVLLIKRSQTGFDDGRYALVSGCIDGNESATQAMIREAHEEAGISLKSEDLDCRCVMHQKTNEWEGICLFFIAKQWSGEICNGEPNKCAEIDFFPLDKLPTNLIPYVREGISLSLEQTRSFCEFGW